MIAQTVLKPNEEIFNILFNSDEITWQSMIYDLVSSEKMDPWDVDVSSLSQKFVERIKKFKEMDLKISGKILLAAAILLRVKSYRFMDEDMGALDSLIASANSSDEGLGFDDNLEYGDAQSGAINLAEKPQLYPRTPQPRKRKVSVFDLVNALEKALEVYQRRPKKLVNDAPRMTAPQKPRDISLVIKDVYTKVLAYFKQKNIKNPKLTFGLLLNNESKEDKIFTFIPLLHLDNQRKIDLLQEKHFGEIEIKMVEGASN